MLSKEGKKVCVIEKEKIAMSTTGHTTAKITSQHDLFYKYLVDSFGFEYAQKYLNANEEAINKIEKIISEENIECEFEKQDSYVYTSLQKEVRKIEEEVETLNALGVKAQYVTSMPFPINICAAVKTPNQAQFNPRKYAISLAEKIIQNGSNIYENSLVNDIKKADDKYITFVNGKKVISKYVAIASHYPIINFPGYYFLKMYQDMSYIILVDPKQDIFENGMYISVETPTRSVRTVNIYNKKFLLVGGSEHKVGANDVSLDLKYKELEDYIKQFYPNSEVLYNWCAQDCISLDKIPYIGQFSKIMPNVYVATGYKKWGMTTSYVAANIIKDKILKNKNPYDEIFNSTRLKPIKNRVELGNMMKQTVYSLVLNKITSPKETLESLKPGTGGVVKFKGEKMGIYKAEDGKIYAVKPYCTHLGCELSWNNLEKTWDCPCHGSRYDYTGKLLMEPSVNDLKLE